MLKSQGFVVDTLIIEQDKKVDFKLLSNLKNKLTEKSFSDIVRIIKTKMVYALNAREYDTSTAIRTNKFREFTEKFITERHWNFSENYTCQDIVDYYDFFVVGSDQVWNPRYTKGTGIYFLDFAPKEKRVSYAASFGVSQLPEEYKEIYKQGLLGMGYLSLREVAGARLIRELIGVDVPVHIDPTLLLTKDEWLAISREAFNKPEGGYILTYFLGEAPKESTKQIKTLAKNNNLEIVNLGRIKEKDFYRTGPSEFIDYINGCTVFCTNSFHGAVFSILFKKPFIVYDRTDSPMFSRLETLLDKFDLNSRMADQVKTNEEAIYVDFSHTDAILELERKKAQDYLRKALSPNVK